MNKLYYALSPQYIARQTLLRNNLNSKVKIFDYLIDKGYTYLDEGRHRVCFLSPNKNWVVKLARDFSGACANASERYAYSKKESRNILARCKLLNSDILVMEYVEYIEYSELPSWAGNIDCYQVGRNRKGEIVAYDYGG